MTRTRRSIGIQADAEPSDVLEDVVQNAVANRTEGVLFPERS